MAEAEGLHHESGQQIMHLRSSDSSTAVRREALKRRIRHLQRENQSMQIMLERVLNWSHGSASGHDAAGDSVVYTLVLDRNYQTRLPDIDTAAVQELSVRDRLCMWMAQDQDFFIRGFRQTSKNYARLGFGCAAGQITAVALRKFGLIFVSGVAGGFMTIKFFNDHRFITIDWDKVFDLVDPNPPRDRHEENGVVIEEVEDFEIRAQSIAERKTARLVELVLLNPVIAIGFFGGLIYRSFIASRRG